MHPLHVHFERSFDIYRSLILACPIEEDVLIYNISLIINCCAYIESLINYKLELHSSMQEFLTLERIAKVPKLKRRGSLEKKWNYLNNKNEIAEKWNQEDAVFSNFNALVLLRNEILHYKNDFLQAGEVPKDEIKNKIMMQVCEEQPYGDKPYHKQFYESWCTYLLKHRGLAEWSVVVTRDIEKKL